jgi:AcrR family transcriptional regulator
VGQQGRRKPRRTRAVTDAAKQARRARILSSAARRFSSREYHDVSMAAIARAAGLAKGTVYLYFDTKESVFLDLVSSELAAWVADSSARLEETNQNATPADVAKAVASALAERPALIRLIALLHVVLEQNTEREALRAFKIRLLAITEQAAGVFEQALRLEPGTGTRLVLWMHALTVGLSQMTPQGAQVVALVEQDPALAVFRLDLRTELEAALTLLFTPQMPTEPRRRFS